ncbi:MAG: CDP-alcohol phosphatidyltransferase family protein [Candidatus Micrarchaeota archaeon]
MLGNKFRSKVKKTLLAVTKPLALLPITPNQFTFLSIPLAAIAAYFIAAGQFGISIFFVVLSILIDVLDGSFAENKKQKTNFGNYWDAVVDKVVESILYVGFVFISPLAAILALAGTMLEGFAKPRVGLVIITDNHDWPAIGERSDRLLILTVGLVLAVLLPVYQSQIIPLVLWLVFLVTAVGFIQRVHYAKGLIEKAEKEKTLLPYLQANAKKRK